MAILGDRFGNRFVSTGADGPGVFSLTASGRVRWWFVTCLEFPDPWTSQSWRVLGSDGHGGAWILESRHHAFIDMQWARLHHVDNHGQHTATIDPRMYSGYRSWGAELVDRNLRLSWIETADSDAHDLRRSLEFDPDGNIVGQRDIARGDPRVVFGRIIEQDGNEDRMFGVAEVLRSPPANYGDDLVLSRITVDNVAEHITTLQLPWSLYTRAPDGALWITEYEQPLTLTRLAMDGSASTVDITPALPDAFRRALFTEHHGTGFLLVGDARLALIGSDGAVTRDIATPGHAPASFATGSEFGWFLPVSNGSAGETAVLYSLEDLALTARFAVDLPLFEQSTPMQAVQWDIGTEGSLLTLDQRRDPDGTVRTRVVGFAVPGSSADVRILRDDFEP